jgi:hypothetical protein
VGTADEILEKDVYLEKYKRAASRKEGVEQQLNFTPEGKRIQANMAVLLKERMLYTNVFKYNAKR